MCFLAPPIPEANIATAEAITMGAVGFVALLANAGVAWMLYAFRTGDSDMRSVWICSRNDAIGNVAVMLAAVGVFGTGSAWPDLAVASVMGVLALTGSVSVLRHARGELSSASTGPHVRSHRWPRAPLSALTLQGQNEGQPARECRNILRDRPRAALQPPPGQFSPRDRTP
jgi:hypothetical protein